MCFIDDRLARREEHQFGCCLPFKQLVAEAGCQGGASTCVCRKKAGMLRRKKTKEKDGRAERKSEPASALKARKE